MTTMLAWVQAVEEAGNFPATHSNHVALASWAAASADSAKAWNPLAVLEDRTADRPRIAKCASLEEGVERTLAALQDPELEDVRLQLMLGSDATAFARTLLNAGGPDLGVQLAVADVDPGLLFAAHVPGSPNEVAVIDEPAGVDEWTRAALVAIDELAAGDDEHPPVELNDLERTQLAADYRDNRRGPAYVTAMIAARRASMPAMAEVVDLPPPPALEPAGKLPPAE